MHRQYIVGADPRDSALRKDMLLRRKCLRIVKGCGVDADLRGKFGAQEHRVTSAIAAKLPLTVRRGYVCAGRARSPGKARRRKRRPRNDWRAGVFLTHAA